MSDTEVQAFGKFRSFIWPIHRYELRKFLPMLFMMFLVCFNYSIVRNLKDTVVVTASGAEVIPFIKLWAMLPGAVLLTLFYTYLSSHYSQERAFYIMVTMFICFYTLFGFVLYPFRDQLHPHHLTETLSVALPEGFSGLIAMLCNWSFTIFYVMCELWGSLVLSVIFWGVANEVTRLSEARRFYSVFSIFSNIAAIAAGQSANYLASGNRAGFAFNFFTTDSFEQGLMFLMLLVSLCGIVIMVIFRWMNKNVLNDSSFDELHKNKSELKKNKKKLSLKDSFSFLSNSNYLLCIAILVLAYNLTINLAEVVWKDQLRTLKPEPEEFNRFLNNVTSAIGCVSTLMSLFMARLFAKFGWTRTAMITPVIMLISCMGFFAFMIFQGTLGPIAFALTGLTPLTIAVAFGAMQNCFSKAMKYSVFDATKEMAFIPLDHETKLNGKAAIDGVGSRCGKSGGSLIHQGLILVFGSLTASASYVAIIILAVITGWITAVRSLGVQFANVARNEDKALAEGQLNDENEVQAVSA
ncbi:MAG: Npt1/Npt2 family nucleotide transporter [Chlamydiota bacterium]